MSYVANMADADDYAAHCVALVILPNVLLQYARPYLNVVVALGACECKLAASSLEPLWTFKISAPRLGTKAR